MAQPKSARTKQTPAQRREKARWYRIKKRYGLTQEQYESISRLQSDECFICKRTAKQIRKPLCVDHDHRTGKVRGLLCSRCNRGLEHFKDKAEYFYQAYLYLTIEKDYGTVP